MKGDAANLTRVLLARLSATSALISLTCFLVFIVGNVGSLSGRAIAVASLGMGAAGLAALSFALASMIATALAPAAGARFSLSLIVIALCSGMLGLAAILGSSIAGAISRGLSF
ncbi:MAG: hypothetical protein A2Y38_24140 [Spirochaetes bacterium GWB1_59_5]|nr:MAG: hypothetical protein A2Y38_24140 [Spirochaetes bacterium GWB1_59_5]